MFTVTLVPFWMAAHVRTSTHISTMSTMALLLGGAAWTKGRSVATRPIGALAATVTVVYAASLLMRPSEGALRMVRDWRNGRPSSIPSLWGLVVPRADLDYYEPLAAFVDGAIPKSEDLYVGLLRHDAPVSSNQMMYAVLGHHGCCRYDELHAGVADRPSVQEEIVSALDAKHVRLVILWQFGWPNRRLDEVKAQRHAKHLDTGSDLLDLFIAREFRQIRSYGEYRVLWRDGTAVMNAHQRDADHPGP